MKRKKLASALVAVGLLGVPAIASAGVPDGAGPWADSYVAAQTHINPRTDGSPVPTGRDDPQAAVGPAETAAGPDAANQPAGTFVSLGIGGTLVLKYDNLVCNGAGPEFDLDVREVTYSPPDPRYPKETADVYVSANGTTWQLAQTGINRDTMVNIPAGLKAAKFIKVVDTTDPAGYAKQPQPGDGIDIDGIKALNTNCVPGAFQCASSAARITTSPTLPLVVEPSKANAAYSPCATDDDNAASLMPTPVGMGAVMASTIDASTTAATLSAKAHAIVQGLMGTGLPVVDGGTVVAVQSDVNVTCNGYDPVITPSSSVVLSMVNGQTTTVSDPMTIPVGPMGSQGTLYLNETIHNADGSVTQRALDFQGSMGQKAVFAESHAGFTDEPCLA